MKDTEADHDKDHLEEDDESLGGSIEHSQHSEDGGDCGLYDGPGHVVDGPLYGVLGLAPTLVLEVNVVVAEVSREVDAEADTHDEVDESDAVEDNVPDGHEAETAGQGAHNAQHSGDCRDDVGQQQDGDTDDDDACEEDALEGLTEYCEVLVRIGKVAVEHVGFEVPIAVVVADVPDLHNHFLLVLGAVDVLPLNEKPGGEYPRDILVIGEVQSVLGAGVLVKGVNLLDKVSLRPPRFLCDVLDEGLGLADGPEVVQPGVAEVGVDVVRLLQMSFVLSKQTTTLRMP